MGGQTLVGEAHGADPREPEDPGDTDGLAGELVELALELRDAHLLAGDAERDVAAVDPVGAADVLGGDDGPPVVAAVGHLVVLPVLTLRGGDPVVAVLADALG